MIRLAVTGAAGRMGRAVIQAIQANPNVELACAIEHEDSGAIGMDAGEACGIGHLGVPVESGWSQRKFDVLIEFTCPQATLDHARNCLDAGGRMVIGTTGLSDTDKRQITALSENMAVVMAPNMSVGVNLCFHLVALAARTLGDDVDIEIVEAHHRHKVDSPSGTALRLGEIAAAAVGSSLDEHAVYGRQGQIGPRQRKTIGFSTIRGGDIVGEHTVLFAGEGERVEITHRSSSRMTFANGAVRAAMWCMQHDKGLFDMQDVLGLNPDIS
jgi:4-hydroxy-tetrahydrodipicolinate reductase